MLITIPTGEGSPTLVIHANLLHNLYHYLSKQARLNLAELQPETAAAAFLVFQAHNPLGPQGTWGVWEEAITNPQTTQQAGTALRVVMTQTVEQIETALAQAEPFVKRSGRSERHSLLRLLQPPRKT